MTRRTTPPRSPELVIFDHDEDDEVRERAREVAVRLGWRHTAVFTDARQAYDAVGALTCGIISSVDLRESTNGVFLDLVELIDMYPLPRVLILDDDMNPAEFVRPQKVVDILRTNNPADIHLWRHAPDQIATELGGWLGQLPSVLPHPKY
jgi:hypothetical protein